MSNNPNVQIKFISLSKDASVQFMVVGVDDGYKITKNAVEGHKLRNVCRLCHVPSCKTLQNTWPDEDLDQIEVTIRDNLSKQGWDFARHVDPTIYLMLKLKP